MSKSSRLFLTLTFMVGLYWYWCNSGRQYEVPAPDAAIDVRQDLTPGDSARAQVVAIQAWMENADYQSEAHFQAKMDLYFQELAAAGWADSNTLVLLPEYIGTWLVVAGEKRAVTRSTKLTAAMAIMASSNPLQTLRMTLKAPAGTKDRVAYALFRMKAGSMAAIYRAVFSKLARQYGVYIQAGSLVLPEPKVVDGQLQSGEGPLFNVSVLFHPDGRADERLSKKAFPISSELPFTACAPVDAIPTLELPFARVATLVCADSWYPETYAHIRPAKPDLVLVPSFAAGDGAMSAPWKGYNGAPTPADVDTSDVHRLTEGQAWQKYALTSRLPQSGAPNGVNVFLRGRLWDLGSDGQTTSIAGGRRLSVPASARGSVVRMGGEGSKK